MSFTWTSFVLRQAVFFHNVFIIFKCIEVLPVCVFLHHVCDWFLRRLEEVIRYPGTRITDSCQQTCDFWEVNLSPLQEQPVLFPFSLREISLYARQMTSESQRFNQSLYLKVPEEQRIYSIKLGQIWTCSYSRVWSWECTCYRKEKLLTKREGKSNPSQVLFERLVILPPGRWRPDYNPFEVNLGFMRPCLK